MIENDNNTVEEVAEMKSNSDAKAISSENVPAVKSEPKNNIEDYLNDSLFGEIRTVKESDMAEFSERYEVDENVEKMYSSTFGDISENSLIQGRVVGMNDRDVLIDIGFKSEGLIDRSEFKNEELPSIGDQVEVYLEFIEDASGNTILSKEKADFMKRWKELNDAFENQTIITGKIVRRIKGGLIVDLEVVQAFLPGSQVDVRPIMDFDVYLDKDIELRIVKFNESRKNIVVSHKVILEESLKEQRDALFQELEVGSIL